MRLEQGAVYGFGDVNADFHVVGDSPHRHGGLGSGIPFGGGAGGWRMRRLLTAVGLATWDDLASPDPSNSYLSYIHPGVGRPTEASYRDQERFLDAELRAINAHILLVVGDRPLEYALREHSNVYATTAHQAARVHATEIGGRGFLIIPVADPGRWSRSDERALIRRLAGILDSDYRQTKGVATTVG